MSQLLSVAILGRPNVGKSTLFNRFVGKKMALVHDLPGVTRDWRRARGRLAGKEFWVIDTAGLEETTNDTFSEQMRQATLNVAQESDVILFLLDAQASVTPLDQAYANLLRATGKPILLIVNKCEGKKHTKSAVLEALSLGLGEPIAISAEHGQGLGDLYEMLAPYFPEPFEEERDQKEKPLDLAIIGRPNVGKSTLINRLIGEDRLLTGDQPGVTRDSITIDWSYKGRPVRLIDTAGMRRKAKITSALEKLAITDGLRAIDYAQVVVLVVDHETPLAKQDLILANRAIEEGRVLIVALNKWDQVSNKKQFLRAFEEALEVGLPQVKGVPRIPISAKEGKNLDTLMRSVFRMYEAWTKRITTGQLNRWLGACVQEHTPPLVSGKRIKIKYMTQVKSRPPTFALFVSKDKELPDSYVRYLQNSLRKTFGLEGIPLRIGLRKSKNPYD